MLAESKVWDVSRGVCAGGEGEDVHRPWLRAEDVEFDAERLVIALLLRPLDPLALAPICGQKCMLLCINPIELTLQVEPESWW